MIIISTLTLVLNLCFSMANNNLDAETSDQYNKTLNIFKNKNYKETIIEGEKYVASNPDLNLKLDIYLIIGESYFKLGNSKKAEIIGELLLKDYPDKNQTQDYYARLGYWYGKTGNYKKAIEYNEFFLNSV